MSRSKQSKTKSSHLRILLVSAILTAELAAFVGISATERSSQLVVTAGQKAAGSDFRSAELDYKLALTLTPWDTRPIHQLADLYVRLDRPDDAIAMLRRLPSSEAGIQIALLERQSGQLDQAATTLNGLIARRSTGELLVALSEVRLEQGRVNDATSDAEQAYKLASGDSAAQIQLGYCLAVGGNADKLADLIVSVTAPEALKTLKAAQLGKSPLARELYASGLLRSARTVLKTQPDPSSYSLRMLGSIELSLARNQGSYLSDAQNDLESVTTADPANLEGHQLLLQVYQKQGNVAAAAKQADLIERIKSGKV